MKKILLATTALVALSLPAAAADMRMPVKAPAYAPAYSWTGLYLGGTLGGVWADTTAFSSFDAATMGALNQTRGLDSTGFIGGVHVGYNWQVSPSWVIGLEADISWADASDSATAPNINLVNAVIAGGFNFGRDLNWLGTVRGRVGALVTPTALVYVTGGVAFADFDYTANYTAVAAGAVWNSAFSDTATGWTLGAGLEWMLAPNWTVRAEYLYVNFDDTSATVNNALFPANPVTFNWRDQDLHIVRAGLSYKF
jgi:outer membrane immunogenic protein